MGAHPAVLSAILQQLADLLLIVVGLAAVGAAGAGPCLLVRSRHAVLALTIPVLLVVTVVVGDDVKPYFTYNEQPSWVWGPGALAILAVMSLVAGAVSRAAQRDT
ncbi:MAG TPA: hypothetical protein VMA83_06740 [Solirubrobacteraceae bacterium]|nr:hypothetical protein [Solirubrobacteraceae bacterium]